MMSKEICSKKNAYTQDQAKERVAEYKHAIKQYKCPLCKQHHLRAGESK